jgi:hypothetical protein
VTPAPERARRSPGRALTASLGVVLLLAAFVGALASPGTPSEASVPTDWTPVSSGTTSTLFGVACPSTTACVAVGSSGTVLTSADGGATWTARTSGTGNFLLGVACPSASACVAVGGGGTVLRGSPQPPATPTATQTATGTPTQTPTVTSTPTSTATATPTRTATSTPT